MKLVNGYNPTMRRGRFAEMHSIELISLSRIFFVLYIVLVKQPSGGWYSHDSRYSLHAAYYSARIKNN